MESLPNYKPKDRQERKNHLWIATIFDKKCNSKCIQSTACPSRPNKKSQEMGGPMAFQHLYPSTEKAVPNNLCSWSPELQASTGEIYNAALTASSVRGGFPLALCRKCSKQFHWKASLKHIYISKLSLRKSSLSQSVHWGFPTTS